MASTTETQYKFDLSEADLDLILAEELACNQSFRSWFLSTTGAPMVLDEAPLVVGRSVANFHGETDVLVVHCDHEGKKRALLIENKISAIPMEAQAERYLVRGQQGVEDKHWDTFVTVLVAPEKYLSHTTMKFQCEISYERLLSALGDDSGDARALFKRRLIALAIGKASKPWTPTLDPDLTKWFVDARAFGISEFPDLPLPEERDRAPTSTWISFTVGGFVMSRVLIEIKPHRGHVDLRFNKVELGEMRRAFGKLPVGANTTSAKRSCAIRLACPAANVRLPFETQKHVVRPMMAAADVLLKFAVAEKAAIMKLLGYGNFSASG